MHKSFSIDAVHDLEGGSLEVQAKCLLLSGRSMQDFPANTGHMTYRHIHAGPHGPVNQDIELAAIDVIHHRGATEETLLIFSPDGVTELEIHEEQLSQAKEGNPEILSD